MPDTVSISLRSYFGHTAEDRKRWHRTIAQFDDDVEKCEHCGGPMEQATATDPASDSVEYYSACRNPDCPSNNQ